MAFPKVKAVFLIYRKLRPIKQKNLHGEAHFMVNEYVARTAEGARMYRGKFFILLQMVIVIYFQGIFPPQLIYE